MRLILDATANSWRLVDFLILNLTITESPTEPQAVLGRQIRLLWRTPVDTSVPRHRRQELTKHASFILPNSPVRKVTPFSYERMRKGMEMDRDFYASGPSSTSKETSEMRKNSPKVWMSHNFCNQAVWDVWLFSNHSIISQIILPGHHHCLLQVQKGMLSEVPCVTWECMISAWRALWIQVLLTPKSKILHLQADSEIAQASPSRGVGKGLVVMWNFPGPNYGDRTTRRSPKGL